MRLLHRHALVLPVFALALAGCPDDPPPPDTHGFVKIGLLRGTAETMSPYTGTAKVRITMSYDSCFTGFYDTNPNWSQAGVDGALVFGTLDDGGEGWRDRLCDPQETAQAECSVDTIEQRVTNDPKQMTIIYSVGQDVENRFLKFGPLPLIDEITEFECDGGLPRVTMQAQQMVGLNASGAQIWSGQSLESEGEATPGQGKQIGVRAARGD